MILRSPNVSNSNKLDTSSRIAPNAPIIERYPIEDLELEHDNNDIKEYF